MEDTYKGESSAKKRARLEFWRHVLPMIDGHDGKIIVLASREAGDYGTLRALGRGPDVISVDRCPDAVFAARAKYPEADIRLGDVAAVAESITEPLDSAFLDFCGPLGPQMVDTVLRVAHRLRLGSILGVGFLKAREQDTNTSVTPVLHNRRMRRLLASKSFKTMCAAEVVERGYSSMMAFGLSPMTTRGFVASAKKSEAYDASMARVMLLMEMIGARMDPRRGRRILCQSICEYQSSTDESRGVPMTYVALSIEREIYRDRDWRNRSGQQSQEETTVKAGGRPLLETHEVVADETWLRQAVLDASADGLDAAALLNVQRSRVAAWKAHAARGTYDKVEAAE